MVNIFAGTRLLAALAIFGAGLSAGLLIQQPRVDSAKQETLKLQADHAEKLAAGYAASLKVYKAANDRAKAAERAAEQATNQIRKEREAWKQSSSEARRTDPDCAAWASQPLLCPLPDAAPTP